MQTSYHFTDSEKIDILKKFGFNEDFKRDVFFNSDTCTAVSLEFIQDNDREKIEDISKKHNTDPTFYFSYGEPKEPLRTQLINNFFPGSSSGLKSKEEKGLDNDQQFIYNLRSEYDNQINKMNGLLDYYKTEIEYLIRELKLNCKKFEKIEFSSRIKTFESCITKLKKKNEANVLTEEAKLSEVKDLIGIRMLVFPNDYIEVIKRLIMRKHNKFTIEEIDEDKKKECDFIKFFVYFNIEKFNHILVEIQILPYLLGKYWDIEHSLIYKPQDMYPHKVQKTQLKEISQQTTQNIVESSRQLSKKLSIQSI